MASIVGGEIPISFELSSLHAPQGPGVRFTKRYDDPESVISIGWVPFTILSLLGLFKLVSVSSARLALFRPLKASTPCISWR